MAVIDSLKETYFSLEDKWYSFVDTVSEKAPFFGTIIDTIEDKGVPTFPAAIVLVLLILLIIFILLNTTAMSSLTITVLDSRENPIEGASVIILQENQPKETKPTNSEGKAVFSLPNGEYTIKTSKGEIVSDPKKITLNQNTEEELTLSLGETTITKSVYLKTADGGLMPGSGTLIYKCKGSPEEETAAYSGGVFKAIVKESCTEIEVLSVPTYNLIKNTASFAANNPTITVQKSDATTGTVTVTLSIEGTTENPPAGLRVSLVPSDNTTPIMLPTTGTALLTFTNVPAKKYYVLISSDGKYQPYDGSKINDVKDVLKDTITQFNTVLKKAVSSAITITIKDKLTNNPVSGAEIRLALASNQNDYKTKITGATGQAVFDAAEGNNYFITIDHPDYITGKVEGIAAGQEKIILLEKADESNSNSLLVKVLDPKKNPVENARVILKKIDPAEPIVGEKTTGATGEAQFYNLEPGTSYMASVSKEGYGSVNSTTTQVSAKQVKELEVTFDIGYGSARLKVMDPEKNPLKGVTIKAINYYTSQQETTIEGGATKITNTEGIAEYTNIRADKKIYFTIEANGYAKYFTASITPESEAVIEKEIIMQRTGGSLAVLPIEIYSGSQQVASSSGNKNTIGQGTYTIKALLIVPKGTFSEAGIHLRTGKQTENLSNLMEEDGLLISEAQSSGRLTKGTTFTPPNGYDKDLKNLTQGNAKWINSIWRNPQEGVYELEAQTTITETNPNAPLSIRYRGWVKGSTVLRDPASTTSAQNELYSTTKERILSFGATNLCSGSFCKSYSIEALTGTQAGKPKKYITGTFEAKLGTQYLLTADLTNYSGKTLSGTSLTVEGKSLEIKAVSINGTEQTDKTINLGSISADMPVKVQVLFTATNTGTSGIKLTINSSTQTELEEIVTINVKPNKNFSLSILPKIIIPYIANSMFFEAKDSNTGLESVLIEIKSGKQILGNITTTGEGLAKYELSAPRIGDTITITARKEGYNPQEAIITVDDALLTITPPTIEETIKIGEVTAISESMLIQNNTASSLKIKSAEITGEIKSFLEVKFSGNITGAIEQGKDKNAEVTMKVLPSAQRLKEPKEITGKILIVTEVPGTGQSYLNEIEIIIHLTMPGYLDSPKCLKLSPTTLEFITSDTEQTKTITLTNSCTAEGTKVTLHNLEAKLSEAAKFGTISISGQGFMNTSLSDKYVKIADDFASDAEIDLSIRFNPNPAIASGTQSIRLTINGKNVLQDKATEKTEASVNLTTTMSNLSKCVTIVKPEGGIIIDVAPWNLGYGRLMASDMSAYARSYGGFANRGAYSPYGYGGMHLPGMGMQGYGMQGYGAGYGMQYPQYAPTNPSTGTTNQQMTPYAQSAFTVRNECETDIDVELDVDSRISASSQKFTLNTSSSETITIQPGYVLGLYKIKVNAKPTGTKEAKKKIGEVNAIIRRLGEMDTDCIKTNITKISLNSMIMRPQRYSVYNYCYDTGVQLSRNNVATVTCSAPRPSMNGMAEDYFQVGLESQYMGAYPLGGNYRNYYDYLGSSAMAGMQMNGCPTNACSLIAGTDVWFRSLQQGGPRGTIEKVDFQVYPSPQYVPQRKLLDPKTNRYGPFQTIGDFRQWMTESDARMNVYGQLHISYSNQYGVAQCQDYPITLEDIWRVSEILDSAINWGDPDATPQECQNKNALNVKSYWETKDPERKGAIPENQYLGNKTEYIYISEAPFGPALRIGPAPNQSSLYYPRFDSSSYYELLMRQKKTDSLPNTDTPTASKNCGLLDSIEVLTQLSPEKTGGAIIIVEPTPLTGSNATGSMLKNTRGRNLMVTVDRSQMNVPCIHINTPITAKVSRQIGFESQQLVWMLNIIITRPDYIYDGDDSKCKVITDADKTNCEDLLKQKYREKEIEKLKGAELEKAIASALKEVLDKNPQCKPFISGDRAKQLYNEWKEQTTPTTTDACGKEKATEYGYDKITQTKLETIDEKLDCTTSFCNSEMLKAYLLMKFSEIKEKVKTASASSGSAESLLTNPVITNESDKVLSKLYKQALIEKKFSACGSELMFYKNAQGGLLKTEQKYAIPSTLITATDKTAISAKADAALKTMQTVLEKVLEAEPTDILLEVPKSGNALIDSNLEKELGMQKVADKYYMTLKAYKELNQVLSNEEGKNPASNCTKDNIPCTINWCEKKNVNLTPETFQHLAGNGTTLVKGISDKTDLSKETIEKIYSGNPALAEIHNLALFNTTLTKESTSQGTASKDLLLTKITNLNEPLPNEVLNSSSGKALADLKLTFVGGVTTAEIGQYEVELDYKYFNNSANDVNVRLSKRESVDGAPNASKNILLQTGFEVIEVKDSLADSINGTIIKKNTKGEAVFYKRIPVKLTATIYGRETSGLKYYPANTALATPNSLINWYTMNGTLKGADTKEGAIYKAPLTTNESAQTIKGIYYYPNGGALKIIRGIITGGQITAKQAVFGTEGKTVDIKTGTSEDTALELQVRPNDITLDQIVKEVQGMNTACPAEDKILWNEKQLIAN